MADKKIQLKRNNASTIDNLFPVVRITDAVESDGTTSFLDGGKIRSTYLPSYVIGGLRFVATQSLATSTSLSAIFGSGTTTNLVQATTADEALQRAGSYVIVTTGGDLTSNSPTPGSSAGYQFNAPGDEGDDATPITLEAGDWIVFRQRTASGSPLSVVYYFDIINNTYQDATNANKGVVTVSASTSVATTGSAVITDGILNGLMGTTGTKIAYGNHLHTDVYEPHNDGLTDLAGLLTTGTQGFVRINGVNDASLDTNSYLNASTTSTQSGYFGNIHLQDDTNPSHYLGITTASDLTAARTLSLVTGDADRSITLGGNLSIAGNFSATTAAVTINATAGGSTLGLPTSISFPALATNDVLYASGTNTVGKIASTTIGRNLLQIGDLSAVAYARFNADETISMLDAASFRSAIGAGTSSTTGTVTSIATSGAITGGTITTTGTISHSTADGFLHVPTTSTTNDRKFLVAGSTAGSFAWESFPRTFYDTTSGTISGDIIFDEVA